MAMDGNGTSSAAAQASTGARSHCRAAPLPGRSGRCGPLPVMIRSDSDSEHERRALPPLARSALLFAIWWGWFLETFGAKPVAASVEHSLQRLKRASGKTYQQATVHRSQPAEP